jgi:hypothetical protein
MGMFVSLRRASASADLAWWLQSKFLSSTAKPMAPIIACAALLSVTLPALAQFSQQGPKLIGSDAVALFADDEEGASVAVSADGNTAIVGEPNDKTKPERRRSMSAAAASGPSKDRSWWAPAPAETPSKAIRLRCRLTAMSRLSADPATIPASERCGCGYAAAAPGPKGGWQAGRRRGRE